MKEAIAPTIESIAVLGASTRGRGIAQVAAGAGYRVILRDVDHDALGRGVQAIERNLEKGIKLARLTEADRDQTLQHIRATTRLEEAVQVDLVIEAATEQLELKKQILRELESFADRPFIFATNTSSLSMRFNIAEYLHRELGCETFRPLQVLRPLIGEGKLGRKTGQGFYDWNDKIGDARRAYSS